MKFIDKIRFKWRALRYRYLLDPGEINAIISYINPGDHVVDIGAHKGAYAYWMQKEVGVAGQLTCFEPQTILVDYLKTAVAGFGWQNVLVEFKGVSSEPGELALYIPGGKSSSPGASLEKTKDTENAAQASVDVITLDNYFGTDREKPIGLIKCDVEGHELEVFKGARLLLEQDKPVLLFECEDRHRPGGMQEVFDYLEQLGYEGHFIDGKQARPLKEFRQEQHQVPGQEPYLNNFLFLPV
jgi:FkbM family methyltransferase